MMVAHHNFRRSRNTISRMVITSNKAWRHVESSYKSTSMLTIRNGLGQIGGGGPKLVKSKNTGKRGLSYALKHETTNNPPHFKVKERQVVAARWSDEVVHRWM